MTLRRQLRQQVLWKQSTGQNADLSYSYTDPVEIPARVEEKTHVGASGPGEAVLATTNIIVTKDVREGDMLATDTAEPRYEAVESRVSYVDMRGRVLGYKCYLEPVNRS